VELTVSVLAPRSEHPLDGVADRGSIAHGGRRDGGPNGSALALPERTLAHQQAVAEDGPEQQRAVPAHEAAPLDDRRLPDLMDALRPGDLFILTSDHGCDPTTSSTDHSREYAMLLAYVAGRNATGLVHEGEFADVGATVNAWLKGKAPLRGIPGQPILPP